MRLTVRGLDCLGSFGAGIEALRAAGPLSASQEDGRAKDADLSALKERVPARSLRQMDRFTRMALLAMLGALNDAGIRPENGLAGTGIILVTGYGPATPTFGFLDSLLEHGEQMASPLSFSHSVHNIPASSLAMALNLAGPCLTICQRENPVASGLLAARQWIEEGRVQRVLFGAVDEHTPLLANLTRGITARRAQSPPGREGLRAALPLGEGAAFFCLESGETGSRGTIADILFRKGTAPDLLQHAEENETVLFSGAVPPAALSHPLARYAGTVYGNIPVAQAFDLALALSCRTRIPSGRSFCCCLGAHGQSSGIRVRRGDDTEGPA